MIQRRMELSKKTIPMGVNRAVERNQNRIMHGQAEFTTREGLLLSIKTNSRAVKGMMTNTMHGKAW